MEVAEKILNVIYSTTSANFRSVFVHSISYRPTDLSLIKGFSKKFSFEDFHNFFEENCPGQWSMVQPKSLLSKPLVGLWTT